MSSETEEYARILRAAADNLERFGFPKEPFYVQTDPKEDTHMFLTFWRDGGDRRTKKIELAP